MSQASAPVAPAEDARGRVDVLGVGISTVSLAGALDTIAGWIRRRERHYVCVTGVHGVMESQRDPELADVHNASGLTVPDGMPMVWCCHRAGAPWVTRVYGPDLMRDVCAAGADAGWRMFLYGATPETVQRLTDSLTTRWPGLQVVGSICPPFRALTDDERAEIVAEINRARPDIVWVGLSTPKQERWMRENRAHLDAPVLIGVGAAFDFLSGAKRQAPLWMQRHGLEWVYRMCSEPRRLWKRYLTNNPAFVARIMRRPPRMLGEQPYPATLDGAVPQRARA